MVLLLWRSRDMFFSCVLKSNAVQVILHLCRLTVFSALYNNCKQGSWFSFSVLWIANLSFNPRKKKSMANLPFTQMNDRGDPWVHCFRFYLSRDDCVCTNWHQLKPSRYIHCIILIFYHGPSGPSIWWTTKHRTSSMLSFKSSHMIRIRCLEKHLFFLLPQPDLHSTVVFGKKKNTEEREIRNDWESKPTCTRTIANILYNNIVFTILRAEADKSMHLSATSSLMVFKNRTWKKFSRCQLEANFKTEAPRY